MPPRSITTEKKYRYRYSVCTLVTNTQEYEEMISSYIAAGFTEEICEFLYADNTLSNQFEAFGALNQFLQEAQGEYIILCHQDIILHDSNRVDLESRIREMDSLDPSWGILSNAGGVNLKHVAMHITQPTGNRFVEKNLPLRVITVDENFILVKHRANLALSSDLSGFHLYGTDICLIAEALGFTSYVINFNLIHKSDGNANRSFFEILARLKKKYRQAFRGRFVSTTITRFYISGSKIAVLAFNTFPVLFLSRQYFKLFKPKRKYSKGITTKKPV